MWFIFEILALNYHSFALIYSFWMDGYVRIVRIVIFTILQLRVLAYVLNFMPLIHAAKVKAQTFGGRGTRRKRDRGRKEEKSYIEIDMNLMRETKAAYLVSERSQPMYVATVQLKFQLMVNIYTFQIVYHILTFCSSRAHTHTYTHKHTFCIRFTLSSWTTLANSLTKHSILL